jgi:3-hydroxybutyryl-CoA dehydratase
MSAGAPAAGAALGPWTLEAVDPDAMRAMGELLADPNPIHFDADAARAAGLGDRPINQGPANFGYVLEMLRAAVPGATVRDLDVRLLGQVAAGDRVVAAGRVEETRDEDGVLRIACAVWLDVDGGSRALDGTAVLTLPRG